MIHPNVNDEFNHNDKTYQCIVGNDCFQCDFKQKAVDCRKIACSRDEREDKTHVVFKELTKEEV